MRNSLKSNIQNEKSTQRKGRFYWLKRERERERERERSNCH